MTDKPAPRASQPPGAPVSPSRTPEAGPARADASAARTEAREPNAYEANRELFEELDRETVAAHAAMAANDMDAWNTHAGRAAEIHVEIAKRLGWDTSAPSYGKESDHA